MATIRTSSILLLRGFLRLGAAVTDSTTTSPGKHCMGGGIIVLSHYGSE